MFRRGTLPSAERVHQPGDAGGEVDRAAEEQRVDPVEQPTVARQDRPRVLHVEGALDPGLAQVTELPKGSGDDGEEEQAREREVRESGDAAVQDARNEARTQETADRSAHCLVRRDVLCEPPATPAEELAGAHGSRVRRERRGEREERDPRPLLQGTVAPKQSEAGRESA